MPKSGASATIPTSCMPSTSGRASGSPAIGLSQTRAIRGTSSSFHVGTLPFSVASTDQHRLDLGPIVLSTQGRVNQFLPSDISHQRRDGVIYMCYSLHIVTNHPRDPAFYSEVEESGRHHRGHACPSLGEHPKCCIL